MQLRKAESGKSTVTTEDVRMAKGKYEESKTNMANQMMALLDSDVRMAPGLALACAVLRAPWFSPRQPP